MSVHVQSLGCRLNRVEGEALRARAEEAGLRDLAVVNTCSVTAEAVRQSRQAVRRLARERPGTRVVATGCAVETDRARFLALPDGPILIGNAEKMTSGAWRRLAAGASEASRPGDGDGGEAALEAPNDAASGRVRATVAVQTGCDHACTFCSIPHGRGRSRSAPPDRVVASVRDCLRAGAREVVLTGVDLTAYGRDLPDPTELGRLVRLILAAVPDLPRLRLSSLDSVEVDDELFRAIADEPRLMPHLHLSLQAGHDLILKRMKRRHGRADAIRFCERVRAARPDVVIGADLIAGFPTETGSMFRDSLALVGECGLSILHVFPFSARPGTPAARMPPVPQPVVRERAARLRDAGAAALARRLGEEVGRGRQVLVEGSGLGRTEGFLPVRFAAPRPKGTLATVRIAGSNGRELAG